MGRHFCFVQFSEFKVAQSLLGKEHIIKGVSVKIGEAAPKGWEDRGGGRDFDRGHRFGGYDGGYGGRGGGPMGGFGGGHGGGYGGTGWGSTPGRYAGAGPNYGAQPGSPFGANGGGYGGGNSWSNNGARHDRRY